MSAQAGDAAQWQERLTAYLDENIRHYAEADVPVGALLSGGSTLPVLLRNCHGHAAGDLLHWLWRRRGQLDETVCTLIFYD